jgi:hypothetical protein
MFVELASVSSAMSFSSFTVIIIYLYSQLYFIMQHLHSSTIYHYALSVNHPDLYDIVGETFEVMFFFEH